MNFFKCSIIFLQKEQAQTKITEVVTKLRCHDQIREYLKKIASGMYNLCVWFNSKLAHIFYVTVKRLLSCGYTENARKNWNECIEMQKVHFSSINNKQLCV